jgi:hypothetical protein
MITITRVRWEVNVTGIGKQEIVTEFRTKMLRKHLLQDVSLGQVAAQAVSYRFLDTEA